MPGTEFCEEKSSKVSIDCAHGVGPCVVWAGVYLSECVCVCVCVCWMFSCTIFYQLIWENLTDKLVSYFGKTKTLSGGKHSRQKTQQMSRFEWT